LGRASLGVRGSRLTGDDQVVGMEVMKGEEGRRVLVVMENGLSKTSNVTDYRFQGRGGSGVKTANITAKTGKVIGARVLTNDMNGDLILISSHGQMIRLPLKQIPTSGRATQGVYVMRLKEGDRVASLSLILEDIEKQADAQGSLPLKK
jgi:DNA gyrase subunit A